MEFNKNLMRPLLIVFILILFVCFYPSFCKSSSNNELKYVAQEDSGNPPMNRKVKKFIDDLNNPGSDDDTRHTAVWALGNLGDKRAVPYIIKILETDKNENIRSIAAEALGKLGDKASVDPLIKSLKDKDWGVRVDSVYALGRLKNICPDVVSYIIPCLKDEDETVRMIACRVLGNLKDSVAVEPLCESLKDKNDRVKRTAIVSLGMIGDEKAIEPLSELLDDKDDVVRVSVIQAMGDIKGKEAIHYVLDSLNDKNSFVRLYSIIILGKIGDESALAPLEKMLSKEQDKDTKEAIEKSIKDIKRAIN